MRWFRLVAIFATLAFVFVGCDDKDSDEAKKYELQKALDDGDYAKVLRMTSNCTDEKCLMDRAAAYAGKAGFTVADVIASINGDEEFYKNLGSGKANASVDLNSSKDIYEKVITKNNSTNTTLRDSVCEKGTTDYKNASYYQQASCFPHGMVVMARSAVLMNGLLDKYNGNASVIDVNSTDKVEVDQIVELINNDLGTILNLFGADNADTVDEINKIKAEMCTGATCTRDDIKNYLETH